MLLINYYFQISLFRIPKEGEYLEGNDRYEGFAVDLVDGISKMLGFKYVLRLVDDNKHGSYNKETKKWNGLVKELLDRVRFIIE